MRKGMTHGCENCIWLELMSCRDDGLTFAVGETSVGEAVWVEVQEAVGGCEFVGVVLMTLKDVWCKGGWMY